MPLKLRHPGHFCGARAAAELDAASYTTLTDMPPDYTIADPARGAATKAVVRVRSNRCDLEETTRDMLGVDERDRKDDDQERKRIRRNWPPRRPRRATHAARMKESPRRAS
jgi:hypothetical protein